ncbi:MAG: pantoate--beta-alanine ligase [Desulfobacteraceae bacterium]|nr:MAG: pantoate--beta-alanine ligase [Desulfobacteraceae bacterium]
MEVIEKVEVVQRRCEDLRLDGKILALVPTMGFFHEGHLELMRVARRHADVVIISIFVNPTQFGPSEDFAAYPRDMEGDLDKAGSVGVDIAFTPRVEEMYPEGFQTTVSVANLANHLCGLSRPGHFQGVTTVVAKLFNIAKPHFAVFGQKDFQQLTVITRMVKDLNMDIQIVGVPTYREPDGLAMSSRNTYLSEAERKSALALKKSLDAASGLYGRGERDAAKMKAAMEEIILAHPYTKIDYVAVCDPVSLESVETIPDEAVVALAVRVGKTRLIDNCLLGRDRN